MSSTKPITSQIANYLSAYVFDKVWNEPFREYRKNILPYKVGTGMFTGNARLGKCSVKLPEEATAFLVYTLPRKAFGGIKLSNVPEWVSVPEFLATRNIELRFEGFDGKSLYRGDIYIRTSPENNDVLIAVKRKMFIDILGLSTPTTDIYISVYFDSDRANDLQVEPFYILPGIDSTAIFNKTQAASFVLINGLYTTVSSVSEVSTLNTYVEVVTDANITGSVDFDLSDNSTLKEFESSYDSKTKKLLHIPKAINPEDEIITHNTCDFFIWTTDLEGKVIGRFVNRTLSDHRITQVTHNDFGLDLDVITEYQTLLGTTDLTLTLFVRTHSKNNKLIRDKNYLDLLYTHDDATIIEFLGGTGPEDFAFWKAPHLEASLYVKMFFNTPNSIGDEHIDDYIDVLGYYQSIALISERVYRTTVPAVDPDLADNTDVTFSGSFTVPVPVVFGNTPVYPNVLVNGLKIDDVHVIADRCDARHLRISFHDSYVLEPLAEVIVELFEKVVGQVAKVYATATEHSIKLISDKYVLHEKVERQTPIKGIDKDYDHTYLEISDPTTVANIVDLAGQLTMVFKPETYGRTFVIGYDIGFRKMILPLDDKLKLNEPLVFDLNGPITDTIVDSTFKLDTHTSEISATGTMIDPADPSVVSVRPAWFLRNGKQYNDPQYTTQESRWGATLDVNHPYRDAKYTLAAEHQDSYYLIGFKIGVADSGVYTTDNAEAISHNPKDFDILVDGYVVYQVRDKQWWGDLRKVHSHFLDAPVKVKGTITIRVHDTVKQTYVAFDSFEPIFAEPQFNGSVPLIDDVTVIPYLNGRELVEGIDYEMLAVQDPAVDEEIPHLSGKQMVITNASYLVGDCNELVLLITRNTVAGKISGFLRRDQLGNVATNAMWFDELSMVTVDGYATENTSDNYGSVAVDKSKFRNGGLYGTRTLIPKAGRDFVECYHEDDDTPVIDLLVAYFAQFVLAEPSLLVMPYSHRLVSPYLAIISRDVIMGNKTVEFLAADQDFIDQFAEYEYLKPMDLVLRGEEQIELDFIDVQPTYVEQISRSTIMYRVLHRLVKATLAADNVQHRRYDHEPNA